MGALAALLLAAAVAPVHPDEVAQRLAQLHARHQAQSSLVAIGRSHEGRPLLALRLGSGGGPAVLLSGGVHGGELMSIEFVLDAAQGLLEGPDAAALSHLTVWCVPIVNPDGVAAFLQGSRRTGRKNGRDNDGDGRPGPGDGVDLNRNFPFLWGALGGRGSSPAPASYYYRGPAPASEPETRALMLCCRAGWLMGKRAG